jgi:hypothetical protein
MHPIFLLNRYYNFYSVKRIKAQRRIRADQRSVR